MLISKKTEQSFTLIELLIIIVILGILAGLISGNFLSSLQKGRDSQRKNDLAQIQRALEIYYEDKRAYPTGEPPFGSSWCSTTSCGQNDKVYMMKIPNDPASPSQSYKYIPASGSSPQYYYLLSCIENVKNDKSSGVSNNGYCNFPYGTPCPAAAPAAISCTGCGACKYVMGSPNSPPLAPKPTSP